MLHTDLKSTTLPREGAEDATQLSNVDDFLSHYLSVAHHRQQQYPDMKFQGVQNDSMASSNSGVGAVSATTVLGQSGSNGTQNAVCGSTRSSIHTPAMQNNGDVNGVWAADVSLPYEAPQAPIEQTAERMQFQRYHSAV